MALLTTFLLWVGKHWIRLGCRIFGHDKVRVIEKYTERLVVRNFKGSDLRKLRNCYPPMNQWHIYGKLQCLTCGQIFINNVKVDTLRTSQDNLYGGQ